MGKLSLAGFKRPSASDPSYRWTRLLLRKLARRRLLRAAAMVCAGLSVAAIFGSKDSWGKPSPKGPRILSTKLKRCINCKRLFGYVEERYNGVVALYCRCGRLAGATYSPGPSVSAYRQTRAAMKSLCDDTAMWAPLSDHIGSDGQKWHQPGFAALSLDRAGHGFALVDQRGHK